MLSSAESIVVYERGAAIPDRLTRQRHAHYLALAGACLELYAGGLGRPRRELHRAVGNIFAAEADCPSRRIHAFCKLLDDAAKFKGDPHGNAAELRLRVFALAAASHPLVRNTDRLFGSSESEVKARIAAELGEPWPGIEARLYADVIGFQTLESFAGYAGPEAFLSRYNVAQVQACLYRAERMTVLAREDLKTIVRCARLAGLMLEIRRLAPGSEFRVQSSGFATQLGTRNPEPGTRNPELHFGDGEYEIDLSGPVSVLRQTRRYGVNLARFLPALLACRDWSLEAVVQTPWRGKAALRLSSRDGLRGNWPQPPEFDSSVEAAFAEKFGERREGWRLLRESVILHDGQATFVPDFTFRHDDGTEVLFEIVGFWTPEYLEKKRETLRRFARHRILLALPAASLRAEPGENVVVYKTVLKVEPVLQALEKFKV